MTDDDADELPWIPPNKRVTGPTRTALGEQIKAAYEGGKTVDAIAREIGRSYGFVHRLLIEFDVTLRGRGGDYRSPEATTRRSGWHPA